MPQIVGAIMKCEWVQENILLYVYNELPDDARYELEQHLTRCSDCAAGLKGTRQFHATLSKHAVEEPSPNVLTSSRMRLQEALEAAEQGGWWQRFIFEPAAWLRQIQFSPALAAVIFIIGFAGGIGATYKMIKGTQPEIAREVVPTPATESSVTGIQSISQEPGSNQVNIKYDTVSTQEAQGSLNDQKIQQLLLFAARNNFNSGVRMDSVELLTQAPNENNVREVLMYSLQNDTNPGVRLKALDGLSSFVRQDVRVRDAVLQSLINDTNVGVRMQALHLVEPMKADSSVRAVLGKLSQSD